MAGKVSVRRQARRGRAEWVVDRREQGRRVRSVFASKAAAEAEATELRRQRALAGAAWLELSAPERAELIEVFGAARERGVSLRNVWAEWLALGKPSARGPSLRECVRDLIAAKFAAGRRGRYVEQLETDLLSFIRGREQLPIGQVPLAEIQRHVDGVTSLHSRATRLARLSTLFAWAVRAGHVAENPCRRVERISPEHRPPLILSPEQAHRALAWTAAEQPRFLGWLALALLAGVRPEEAQRSGWESVREREGAGHVVIQAQAAKVRWRRVVPLMPLAVEWLAKARLAKAELPLPDIALKRFRRRLRDALGLPRWPADLLRHTAASYLLAHEQDAGKVAALLGNSPGVLLRHYRALVTRAEAGRFWGS